MPVLTGRAEVVRLKQSLDDAFARIDRIPEEDLELRADFARYLCILVSGFTERAIRALVLKGAKQQSSSSVGRFVESRLSRFQNPNAERIAQLVGAFSPLWRDELENLYQDGSKDALDSVTALRHSIAHGDPVGLTYRGIAGYYRQILTVIDHIADQFCPLQSQT